MKTSKWVESRKNKEVKASEATVAVRDEQGAGSKSISPSERRARFAKKRRRVAGKVARVYFAAILVFSLIPTGAFIAYANDEGAAQNDAATPIATQADEGTTTQEDTPSVTPDPQTPAPSEAEDPTPTSDDSQDVIILSEAKDLQSTGNDAQPNGEATTPNDPQPAAQSSAPKGAEPKDPQPTGTDLQPSEGAATQPATPAPAQVTIAFDANMQTGEAASDSRAMDNATIALNGTEASLPINTYAREGYTFVGWSTAADGLERPGQERPTAYASATQKMTDLTYTLQAKRVTYADGTSRVIPEDAWNTYETVTANADEPAATQTTVTYNLADYAENGNVKLYAQWVKTEQPEEDPSETDAEAGTAQPGSAADQASATGIDDEDADASEGASALKAVAKALALSGTSVLTAGGTLTSSPQEYIHDNEVVVAVDKYDELEKDGDVALYNLQRDANNTIDLTFNPGLFNDSDSVKVKVELPLYGIVFQDILSGLSDQDAMLSGQKFVVNAEKYNHNGNATLEFILREGNSGSQHKLHLTTKYAALTNNQCAQIIESGWQDSALIITVSKPDGTIIAQNSDYRVRPNANAYNDIVTVAEHSWNTVGDRRLANIDDAYLSLFRNGNNDLYFKDYLYVTVQTVGNSNNAGLAEIKGFRVYAPVNEPEGKTSKFKLVDMTFADSSAPQIKNYFSCDYDVKYDENGYEYYEFLPLATMYNKGGASGGESITYNARLRWEVKDGPELEFIDENGGITYQAPNMRFEYAKPVGATDIATGVGSCITTLPAVVDARFSFLADHLKRTQDSINGWSSRTLVTPGKHYSNMQFVTMRLANHYCFGGQDHRFPYKNLVETYSFPYAIQPSKISWTTDYAPAWNYTTISKLICVVERANDARQERVVLEPESRNFLLDASVDLKDRCGLQPGDRISSVEVHYDREWWVSGLTSFFDFDVAETRDGTSDFEMGELVQVGYKAQQPEYTGEMMNTEAASWQNYLYMQIAEQKCPWIICNDVNENTLNSDYNPTDLFPGEERSAVNIAFKGLAGGSYRDYYENPVVALHAKAIDLNGLGANEDPLSFLSGNMTLTANMSGWTINYKAFDTEAKESREAELQIGNIEQDTPLNRGGMAGMHDGEYFLGLKDTEYIQSFVLSYNGSFKFREVAQVTQSRSNSYDGSAAGLYDYAYLLKNVKDKTHYIGFDGDIITSTRSSNYGHIAITATLKHGGGCDVENHGTEAGQASKPTTRSSTNLMVHTAHTVNMKGPSFSATAIVNKRPVTNASVFQGSVLVEQVVFKVQAWVKPDCQTVPIPGNVPETFYIELTDDDVELDKTNAEFLESISAHGISANDVSVITTGEGNDQRRWVKITTGRNPSVWSQALPSTKWNKSNLEYYKTFDFPIKIALRVGKSHETGIDACKPFGDVYWDISEYLEKYDGSPESGLVRVTFEGAEPDVLGLIGDADNSTARLWKGDASDQAFQVLLAYSTGVSVDPGKGYSANSPGIVYNKSMGFVEADRDGLFAAVTVNSPNTSDTVYNYDAVLELPSKDMSYSWGTGDGVVTRKSEATLALTGPAYAKRSKLSAGSITYAYSTNGIDWESESTARSNWGEYRYVKIHADQIAPFESLEVRFPVTTDEPVSNVGKASYLGGTWAFASSADGAQGQRTKMAPAIYQMAPRPTFAVTKNLKAPANLEPNGAHDHSYAFDAGAYSFTITPANNAPMPGGVASDTQPVTAATIAADGTQSGGVATFTGPEYDTVGNYTYTVHEEIPGDAKNADGVSYDAATDTQKTAGGFVKDGVAYTSGSKTFTVRVTEGANGQLVATPVTQTGAFTFTNRYEIANASLMFGGTKTLIGADGQAVSGATGYSLVLEQQQADGSWLTRYDTAVTTGSESVFTPLEYTQLDLDKGHTFTYRIREVIPSNAVNANGVTYAAATDAQKAAGGFAKSGVTYDQTVYQAVVTLADNGNGTMKPNVIYTKVRDANGAEVSPAVAVSGPEAITFRNTYVPKAEVALQATKDLAGRDWTDGDAFAFQLAADHVEDAEGRTIDEAAPLPANTTATATKEHKTTSFAPITFGYGHIGKTYVYKITEPTPASPETNMRYSSAEFLAHVKVVKDNGDGTMETKVTYTLSSGGQTIEAARAEFLNKSVGHETANIFVEKNLIGREWADDDVFTFELEADHVENPEGTTVTIDHDIPMPASTTATADKEDETAEFGAIDFHLETEGNIYYYKIREQVPNGAEGRVKDGITYSDDERDVRVKVHHLGTDTTKMTADVEYKVKAENGEWVWTSDVPAEFDNTYEAAPVVVGGTDAATSIQARKLLKAPTNLNADDNFDWAYGFDAGKYSFTLTPGPNEAGVKAPMPDDPTTSEPMASMTAEAAKGEVNADGSVKANTGYATFGAITFDKAGDYVYTITENIPEGATETTGPQGHTIYTKDGVTYTQAVHNVFVTVTDNGKGQLEAKVEYRDHESVGARTETPPDFTNRYHTADVNVTLSGTKAMDGNSSVACYSFKLERMEDEDTLRPGVHAAERIAGSDENGSFTFSVISFPQWRLGKTTVYHATEVVPDDAVNAAGVTYGAASDVQKAAGGFTKAGVTYDASMFEVSVTISDNGDGTASAATAYKRLRNADGTTTPAGEQEATGLSFKNTYRITGSVSTNFEAAKRICDFEGNAVSGWKIDSGRNQHDWSGDTFGITLTAGENTAGVETPMPQGTPMFSNAKTVGATLDTSVSETLAFVDFGHIEFTAPGTYHYTIEESLDGTGATKNHPVDSTGHLAYDVSTRGVTVVVEDNGVGGLAEPVVTYTGAVGTAETGADGLPLFTNREAGDEDIVLRTVKKMEGGNLADGAFDFELYKADSSWNAIKKISDSANDADGMAGIVPREYTVADIIDHSGAMPHTQTLYYVGREVVPDGAVNADGTLTYKNGEGGTTYEQRMANTWTKDGVTYSTAESRFAVTLTEHVLHPVDPNPAENSVYISKVEAGMSDVDGGALKTLFSLDYEADRTTAEAQAALDAAYDNIEWPVRTNSYAASGEATISVEKILEGRTMTDDDVFTFELTGMDGAPLVTEVGGESQPKLTVLVSGSEPTIVFDPFVFDMTDLANDNGTFAASKTFGYNIREVAPDEAVNEAGVVYKNADETQKAHGGFTHENITYAADQQLWVTIHDNGDGTLRAEYKVDGETTTTSPTLTFTNVYTAPEPEPDPTPCTIGDPPVRKVVTGDNPETPGEFTFTMTRDSDSYPEVEGSVNGVRTVTQTGPGAVEFGNIIFTKPGVYTYTVAEVPGTDPHYTYDDTKFTVSYDVTEVDGALECVRTFLDESGNVIEGMEMATVTNVYTADEDTPTPTPTPTGEPNVTVTKSADKQTVVSGDTVTYTITAKNSGDAAATGVYVKDYVPEGMSYVSCDGAGAKYGSTTDGRAFATWWIESLAPGASEKLTLVVRVNECRDGDKFENTALWEVTGGPDRPSPSTDPKPGGGDGNGDGTSNKVVITGGGSGTNAVPTPTAGGNTTRTTTGTSSASRGSLAKTGDEALPVALAVTLAALVGVAALATAITRRRRN